MTVQDGKFEKPQLKKTVKKTADTPKKATSSDKENVDGVNNLLTLFCRDVVFHLLNFITLSNHTNVMSFQM